MQPYHHRQQIGRPPSTSNSHRYENNPYSPKKTGRKGRLLFLGVIVAIFIFWAGSLWIEQQEILAEKNVELEEMKSKVKEANHLHRELSYQIKRLHDKDYIEEIARRDYFLSRPGEVIFKVPNE